MFEIGPDPAPAAAAGERVSVEQALAAELVLAARWLNELAYELGSDEQVLRRHLSALQTVDRIAQVQLAVADFLRAEDDVAARLARVPLAEMAERIRASTAAPAP